jgi:hypothetical protein
MRDPNTVNWSQLRDAHGLATDVPRLLDGLGSWWKPKRHRSWQELAHRLCRVGLNPSADIFDATVAAVPFLIERLAWARDLQVEMLGLLIEVFHGTGDAGARSAVTDGAPAYLELLRQNPTNSVLRRSAATLLGFCAPHAARIIPALENLAAIDAEPASRAALVLAAGALGSDVAPHLTDRDPWVRWAAAVRLLERRGPDAPPNALDVLIDDLLARARAWEQVCVWRRPDTVELIAAAGHAARRLVPRLIAELPSLDSIRIVEPTRVLLASLFGPGAGSIEIAGLNDDQRQALVQITRCTAAWQVNETYRVGSENVPFTTFWLRHHGLPGAREALREALSIETPDLPAPRHRSPDEEKVARLGIQKEPGWIYSVRGSEVWRFRISHASGKPTRVDDERVTTASFRNDAAYEYFVDEDGDVSRVPYDD